MEISKDDKLLRFMDGFAAAVDLLRRAEDRQHDIEFICLAATVVDSLLRMGLILRHQITTKSEDVLDDLLHQGDSDRVTSEREIFKRAEIAEIISPQLSRDLNELYGLRNRVVHRYVISEISTADVARIANAYRHCIPVVRDAVRVLEDEQVQLGVGMTRASVIGSEPDTNEQMAARKHGYASPIVLPPS